MKAKEIAESDHIIIDIEYDPRASIKIDKLTNNIKKYAKQEVLKFIKFESEYRNDYTKSGFKDAKFRFNQYLKSNIPKFK
jgi:hypothetical protein